MSETAFVDQAKRWTGEMVQRESRGPGDTENAMRRLELRYGLPFSFMWVLRYRPPKAVTIGAFMKLQAAYEQQIAECRNRLEVSQENFVPRNRISQALARAAAYVAGEDNK